MLTLHWLRQWHGSVRQQAISWAYADSDLSHYMPSPLWAENVICILHSLLSYIILNWSCEWRIHCIYLINSLAPGRFENAIFSLALQICIDLQFFLMPSDECHRTFTDPKSTLTQVMAWCCQATSHCLSQCWPSSLSQYGITSLQCIENVAVPICYPPTSCVQICSKLFIIKSNSLFQRKESSVRCWSDVCVWGNTCRHRPHE